MSNRATGQTPDRKASMFDTDHLAVRLAFVVAIGLLVGTIFSVWHEARFGGPVVRVAIGTDFATFHGAAALTMDGLGAGIYTPEVLGAKLAETTGYQAITLQTYGHPPFFVFVLPHTCTPAIPRRIRPVCPCGGLPFWVWQSLDLEV